MGSRAQNFYDILGVSRSATQAEIRGAYLRLMKRYHPDSTSLGYAQPDYATLLNGCYATLRDPVTRSVYDSGLDRALPPTPLRQARDRMTVIARPPRPLVAGPAIGACVFISLVAFALWFPPPRSAPIFASAAGWPADGSDSNDGAAGVPLPNRDRTRQITDLARTSSFTSAEQFSRSCFERARRVTDQSELDSCVLFDLAFLFWRPANEAAGPPYFNGKVVAYRHHDALSKHGDQTEARLARLREYAFSGLIEGFRDHDSGSAPSRRAVPGD